MKQTGMLVVSLRGVNFGVWSRLGCSGQSANILSRQGLVQGFAKKHRITRRETEVKFSFFFFFSFLSCLFQGSKFAYATPRWSHLGVKFKISTSIPVCSIQESPLGLNSCCPERTDEKHKIYSVVFIVWDESINMSSSTTSTSEEQTEVNLQHIETFL